MSVHFLYRNRKAIVFLLVFLLFSPIIFSKTVKVGYYIDSGNFMSGFSEKDPRGGYAYEYIQTIGAYAGWDCEYVYGEWEDLYSALLSGEIDLLSDVSYTKEREGLIFYPDYEMGQETYYIYSNDSNSDISAGDFSTWKGKKIGLRTDCYQYDLFMHWQKDKNLECEFIEFPSSAPYLQMFKDKEFDLLLEIDMVADNNWNPIVRIGSSSFYLAVTKSRPDILNELNSAMAELYAMNPYYNSNLWLKYFSEATISKTLSANETNWLKKNHTIHIGCLNNDLPFTTFNIEENKAEGLIIDIFSHMQKRFNLQDSNISFDFYDNFEDLINDFYKGKINVIAPTYRDLNYAEITGTILSEKISTLVMGLVYKRTYKPEEIMVIAIPKNMRIPPLIKQLYPNAYTVTFDNIEACMEAVLTGTVDVAVSNIYKIRSIINKNRNFRSLNFVELPVHNEIAFLLNKKDNALLSLLNKMLMLIPEENITAATEYYAVKDQGYTRRNFFSDYINYIVIIILIFSIISIALVYSLRQIKEYIDYDVLTKLLTRRKLEPYIENAMNRAEDKNEPFCLMLFDLDDFKKINDSFGHAFGDKVLQAISKEISAGIKKKDKAFRWGGEEFLVIFHGNINEAYLTADRIRTNISTLILEADNTEVSITVTIGLSAYKSGISYREMFLLADECLYKGKHNGKNQVVL